MPLTLPVSTPDHPLHVVLMGDLIGSERTTSVHELHAAFNAAVDAVNQRWTLPSPLTITLGDEFQGLCPTLEDGLQIMRRMRTDLLAQAAPCRFVLGVVQLQTPVNRAKAWNMMGPGLAQSRDKLNDKKDPNAYRFVLPGAQALEPLLDAVGASLSAIEAGWTKRQREVITASVLAEAQPISVTAEKVGLATRTFYKVRHAGQFELYSRQWESLARALRLLDQDYGFTDG